MSYGAKANIIAIYGQRLIDLVADRDQDGRADDPVIVSAMDSATAEMDVYIGQRYTLPLASPPAILTQWCVDIAVYRMSPIDDARTDEMRKRYDDAIKSLKAIAAGESSLGLSEAEEPPAPIAADRPNPQIGSFVRA